MIFDFVSLDGVSKGKKATQDVIAFEQVSEECKCLQVNVFNTTHFLFT